MNFTKPNRATIRYTNSQWLSEDATEASVGKVAVKNPVVNPTLIPSTVPISFPSAHDPAPEVPVGRVAVPKTGQNPPSPRRDASGVLVGRVAVPKQIVRWIIMIEVKVLVGYAPWQMVSGGIGSRIEGPDGDKWSKTTQETLGGSGVSEANGVLRNP